MPLQSAAIATASSAVKRRTTELSTCSIDGGARHREQDRMNLMGALSARCLVPSPTLVSGHRFCAILQTLVNAMRQSGRTTTGRALERIMPDLPSGTVTFLFTDIEGSTACGSGIGRRWQPRSSGTALLRAAIEAQKACCSRPWEMASKPPFPPPGRRCCGARCPADSGDERGQTRRGPARADGPPYRRSAYRRTATISLPASTASPVS